MSNFIGNTRLGLTNEWAIQKLTENCPQFQQKLKDGLVVEKIISTKMTSETGMMSYVYKCDVHFRGQTSPLHYCLKEPDNDRMDDILSMDFYPILIELQDRECDFYEMFSNVPDLKIPQIIDMKRLNKNDKNGYIFMDFVGQGKCRSIPLDKSITLGQMLSVAEQIASLHAFALKNKSSWEGQFKPMNIVATTPDECEEVFSRIVGMLRILCDDHIIKMIEDLRDIFYKYEIYDYVVFDAHLKYGVPSIISHGDLWASNLLFEVDSNNELTNQIGGIVDWQSANAGNPAQDLVRIMLINMDAKERRAAESKVFAHYYKCLTKNLNDVGADPPPFTLEQFTEASRPYLIYQLVLMMFIAAHGLADEKKLVERTVFLERLREGLLDALKYSYLWKDI